MFWEFRSLLGKNTSDKIHFMTWSELTNQDIKTDLDENFTRNLINMIIRHNLQHKLADAVLITNNRGLQF